MLYKRTLSLPKQSIMNDTLPFLSALSPKQPSPMITNHSSQDCHCLCEYEEENHTHLIAINARFRRSNSISSFVSVMFRCESVKKLCTCVKHLQTISTEGK